MSRRLDVKVLKSSRRAETYVYMPCADCYDDLPTALREQFGDAQLVVEFDLHEERILAQADAKAVLDALERQGFYLQLPPPPAHLQHEG